MDKVQPGRGGKHNARVVLKFIKKFIKEERESPTRETIAHGVGWSGASSVAPSLKKLVEWGYITLDPPREPRNINVLDNPEEL